MNEIAKPGSLKNRKLSQPLFTMRSDTLVPTVASIPSSF